MAEHLTWKAVFTKFLKTVHEHKHVKHLSLAKCRLYSSPSFGDLVRKLKKNSLKNLSCKVLSLVKSCGYSAHYFILNGLHHWCILTVLGNFPQFSRHLYCMVTVNSCFWGCWNFPVNIQLKVSLLTSIHSRPAPVILTHG